VFRKKRLSLVTNLKFCIKMKTTLKVFALLAVLGGLVLAACKKYEEGPALSLRTKKSRLAGDWTLDKVFYNGQDVTSQYTSGGTTWKLTIDKGGSWTETVTSSVGTSTDKGSWEFVEKKEQLKMVTDGSTDTDGDTSTIVKLKNKELWLESKSGSNTTRTQLKQ
jgi:hypothetical protein